LTQTRHEQNICEKLQWPFKKQQGRYTKIPEFITETNKQNYSCEYIFLKKNRK